MATGEYVVVRPTAGGFTWVRRDRKNAIVEEADKTYPDRVVAVAAAKDLNPELVVMDTRGNLL